MAHDDPFAGKTANADWAYYLDVSGTYTPELTATTNPNLGADGFVAGTWHRNGHLITAQVRLLFSGTGLDQGSGSYQVTLPFDYDASMYDTGTYVQTVGAGNIRDESTAANRQPVAVGLFDGNKALLFHHGGTFVTHSDPFTWAEGDRILFTATYIADSADLPT